ncbi:MAG: sulfotransferase [Balneolaceae bacterium]
MLNKKVIVLSGYARGGTNIVWNILQSHPEICSPIYETGELFKKSLPLLFSRLLSNIVPLHKRQHLIDSQLFKYKLKNLDHVDNKYFSEEELYSHEQLVNTTLCLKSVNNDISLTEHLIKVYPDLYFIALSRNGYALADSYIRRGQTVQEAGRMYSKVSVEMKKYSDTIDNFKLIKFEDCLQKPFSIAKELFSFVDIQPTEVEKIRLKSKKTINKKGEHTHRYGKENRKYWFDKKSIKEMLDPNINTTQAARLSDKMIQEFNTEAKSALDFFGYEIH